VLFGCYLPNQQAFEQFPPLRFKFATFEAELKPDDYAFLVPPSPIV
jgi:hypothetical protein